MFTFNSDNTRPGTDAKQSFSFFPLFKGGSKAGNTSASSTLPDNATPLLADTKKATTPKISSEYEKTFNTIDTLVSNYEKNSVSATSENDAKNLLNNTRSQIFTAIVGHLTTTPSELTADGYSLFIATLKALKIGQERRKGNPDYGKTKLEAFFHFLEEDPMHGFTQKDILAKAQEIKASTSARSSPETSTPSAR